MSYTTNIPIMNHKYVEGSVITYKYKYSETFSWSVSLKVHIEDVVDWVDAEYSANKWE